MPVRLSVPQTTMLLWAFQQGIRCYIHEYEWPSLVDAAARVFPNRPAPPGFLGSSRADVLTVVASLCGKGYLVEGSRGSRTGARRWRMTDAGRLQARARVPRDQRLYYPQ